MGVALAEPRSAVFSEGMSCRIRRLSSTRGQTSKLGVAR